MTSVELRSTVFVGNIAVFCSETELHQHFSSCGDILEIRLARSEDHSKHLSYGFIRYANVACAQLAMRTLNGSILCGRPLKVDKAQSRTDRFMAKTTEKPQQIAFNSASVHITFISHQIRKIINEETLRFLFNRFGNITDVIITKHNIDERTLKQSGYGFVHFPLNQDGVESALKMSEVVSDLMIDDVNYKCKLSHDLELRLNMPSRRSPPPVYSYADSFPTSRVSPLGTTTSSSSSLPPSSLSDTYSHSALSSTSAPPAYLLHPPPPLLSMPLLPSPTSAGSRSEMSSFYGSCSSQSSGSVSQLQSPSLLSRTPTAHSSQTGGLYPDLHALYPSQTSSLAGLRRTESLGGAEGTPRSVPRNQSQSSSTFRSLLQADGSASSTSSTSSLSAGIAPAPTPTTSTAAPSPRYGQGGLAPEVLAEHLRHLGLDSTTSSPRTGSLVSSLSYDSLGSTSIGMLDTGMAYYPELQRGQLALLGAGYSPSLLPPPPVLLPPSSFQSLSRSPRAVTSMGTDDCTRGATVTAQGSGLASAAAVPPGLAPQTYPSSVDGKAVGPEDGTAVQGTHTLV